MRTLQTGLGSRRKETYFPEVKEPSDPSTMILLLSNRIAKQLG